jgi:hypothetical protein
MERHSKLKSENKNQNIRNYDKRVSYLVNVGVGFPHSAGHGTSEVFVDLAVNRLKKEKNIFLYGDMFSNAHSQKMFAKRLFSVCAMRNLFQGNGCTS